MIIDEKELPTDLKLTIYRDYESFQQKKTKKKRRHLCETE